MSRPTTETRRAWDWVPAYLSRLQNQGVAVQNSPDMHLVPTMRIDIPASAWSIAAEVAQQIDCRWSAVWGDETGTAIAIHALLEREGDYLALRTHVPLTAPRLPSQVGVYPAASRPERHLHDLLGVVFEDHPDPRRWIRHQAWSEAQYPLRRAFPAAGHDPQATPADSDYPFVPVEGSGVVEIPVGPVHAGIIEPGHFRFQAVGETVLRLEERLGYVHKGIEKLAQGLDAPTLIHLAGRVSGDTTVAHAWAACQALERALHCAPSERALALRALLAERERVANHLGDIGAIGNDVGFAFANTQLSRLRERWQRTSYQLFGHRLLMDCTVAGGVAVDLNTPGIKRLHSEHGALRGELTGLFDILVDHPPLDDRLLTTGRLTPDLARRLGTLGYVGRASDQTFDVRHDHPYAPYDRCRVPVSVETDGDVAARMRVRMAEIQTSLDLMDELLETLPEGDCRVPLPDAATAEGLGCVEGWRGEIVTYLRLDKRGRVARFFPRDPSWLNWPALEHLIDGNIVADFPVCNKSINGSYSGHDL